MSEEPEIQELYKRKKEPSPTPNVEAVSSSSAKIALDDGWTLHQRSNSADAADNLFPEGISKFLRDDIGTELDAALAQEDDAYAFHVPDRFDTMSELIHQIEALEFELEDGDEVKMLVSPHETGSQSGTGSPEVKVNSEELLTTIPEDVGREEELEGLSLMEDVKGLLATFCEQEEKDEGVDKWASYESPAIPRMTACPSIESLLSQDTVPVHLYLIPGRQMISKSVRLDATVYDLKSALSRYTHTAPENLDLRIRRHLVTDSRTLASLGAKVGGRIKFTVEANNRFGGQTKLQIPELGKTPGEQIDREDTKKVVKVVKKDVSGKSTTISQKVVVIHPKSPKPNLGGFLNLKNKRTFNHAATDIDREEVGLSSPVSSGVNVALQTFNDENIAVQTPIDKTTQTERRDYYVSSRFDRILRPRRHFRSHEDVLKAKEKAALLLQKHWRRLLAKKELARRADALVARVEWVDRVRNARLEHRKEIQERENERLRNPKRLVDLELLYREISRWREGQEAFIVENRWGAERVAAFALLSELESDLLLQLEATRSNILNCGRDHRMSKELNKLGQPARWLGVQNPKIFLNLDTADRVRCRKLSGIYDALCRHVEAGKEGRQQRLDLINSVHQMISSEHREGPLVEMLLKLLARELKFMDCPGTAKLLFSVRKRVANTFFFLCRDPGFNQEATKMDMIPHDRSKLKKDMVQCSGCRRMQCREQFTIIHGTKVSGRCGSCTRLYRTAILRIDLNLYRQLLSELRTEEFAAGVYNSVTFLIDAFDMRFMVENIWGAQSALSGDTNRYMLRLCRWEKGSPWSPWNCVLLTEDEAVVHATLKEMDTAYQPSFFHKVHIKHATARLYFEGLAKQSLPLDERIATGCVGLQMDSQKKLDSVDKLKKTFRALGAFTNTTSPDL